MLPTLDRTFYRRLAVTAAVLAACRLGSHLPLPGLDTQMVGAVFKPGDPVARSTSIFALGITPLLGVMILAEFVKLFAPSLRRPAHNGVGSLHHLVIALALLIAVVQSFGLATALEGVSGLVAEPGTQFRIAAAATMLAGFALLIALAAIIDRAGLGYGIWLVFLTPTLAELVPSIATIALAHQQGVYPTHAIALAALFTALSAAGIAGLILAGRGSEPVRGACLWPPLIAYTLLSWVLVAVGIVFAVVDLDQATSFVGPGNLPRQLTLVVLVVAVTWLYVGSRRAAGDQILLPAAPIALVLGAIVLAADVLASQLELLLPLGPLPVVVAAVVGTSMLFDWRVVPQSAVTRENEEATQSSGPNR
jgi:hypothetical protein